MHKLVASRRFAVVGAIAATIILGTAGIAHAGQTRIQGEAFSSASGNNVVWTPEPGNAEVLYPGGDYMAMLSNGKVYVDEYFGQPYQVLTLRAQTAGGGWCAHNAHVIVTVDGKEVINTYAGWLPSWSAQSNGGAAQKYAVGWHRIAVTFDNDAYVQGQCDVNLLLDYLDRTSGDSAFVG